MESSFLEDKFNLSDRTVLITGATGQIGYELCSTFVKLGCNVIGADINLGIGQRVNSPRVEYVELDIRNREKVRETIEHVIHRHNALDILINNAGVSTFEPSEERPEEKFDWVMDVNLKGTFFCIQSYVNSIRGQQDKGCIINTSSHYGVVSPDFRIYTDLRRRNSEVYGATKAGIIQMTRYFAVELAEQNIRVNSVSPGGVFNPENPQGRQFRSHYAFRCPMGRMANAEEISGAIVYLASDAASYTTGQNIIIDGGFTAW